MFICATCKQPVGPSVSPIPVIVETRAQEYDNIRIELDEYERETKIPVHSVGTEIVKQISVCPPCYNLPMPVKEQTPLGPTFYQEKLPEPLRLPMLGFVVSSALDRINHNTKRSQRDSAVAVPMVKHFVDNNKNFVF